MKIRSVPSIAFNKSNYHEGQYFMSLYTGNRLYRYQRTELTIDDDVISQVRDLAEGRDSKNMTNNYPMFE